MQTYLILLATLFLVGCGTTREQWALRHCNDEGAYKMGISDGKNNRETGAIALKRKCSPDKQEEILAKYEQGLKDSGYTRDGKHQYGQDLLSDVVNVLNDESKGPEKKTPQEPPIQDESPLKDDKKADAKDSTKKDSSEQ